MPTKKRQSKSARYSEFLIFFCRNKIAYTCYMLHKRYFLFFIVFKVFASNIPIRRFDNSLLDIRPSMTNSSGAKSTKQYISSELFPTSKSSTLFFNEPVKRYFPSVSHTVSLLILGLTALIKNRNSSLYVSSSYRYAPLLRVRLQISSHRSFSSPNRKLNIPSIVMPSSTCTILFNSLRSFSLSNATSVCNKSS